VVDVFKFADSGTRLHSLSVLEGEDGQDIRHDIVVTALILSADVITIRGTVHSAMCLRFFNLFGLNFARGAIPCSAVE